MASRRGPEQKANDEFSPKNFPKAQSATVQCAATSAATPARRESPFAQSDPEPHSKRDGHGLEVGFGPDFVRSRLRRCARSCKTPFLPKSRLARSTNRIADRRESSASAGAKGSRSRARPKNHTAA